MTRRIEKEITSLSFDVREFKKGIEGALKDLDHFKRALEFDKASKNFSNLERSSEQVKFSRMGDAIGTVSARLDALGVIGATVIHRLTNAVIDAGKNLFNKAFVEPMKTGLEEYETQMNSIQTILSNTRADGTGLEDVTKALDELNAYSDLTIYNFTQMTENIGKFTAAGVDLETSVGAIKGIANLAAVSGSNSQQASTAMYQLSQALASGTVKLMDWNSVVNAGMGGEVFKSLLIQFGEVNGTIAAGQVTSESFRDSLQDGWLTSEVLLQTLQSIAGELDEAALKQLGFTEEQAKEIVALAADAQDAATKIKTLTQLFDTMAEAVQSGWAVSWRLIIGDFEQAKDVFGRLSETFGEVIAESSRSRNHVLQVWNIRGGRDLLVDAIIRSFELLFEILGYAKDAFEDVFAPLRGGQLYNATKAFSEFIERFKMGYYDVKNFQSIIRGLASIFDIFFMLISAILKPIFGLGDGLSTVGEGAVDVAASLGDMLFNLRNAIKDGALFDKAVAKVIDTVKNLIGGIAELVRKFISLERVQIVIEYFRSITKEDVVGVFQKIANVFKGIAFVIGALVYGVKALYDWFIKLDVVQKILNYFKEFSWEPFREFVAEVKSSVSKMRDGFNDLVSGGLQSVIDKFEELKDGIKNSELVQAFLDYFATFDGRRWADFTEQAKESFSWFTDVIDIIKESLGEMEFAGSFLEKFLTRMGEGGKVAIENLIGLLQSSTGEINWVAIFGAVNTGLMTLLSVGLFKLFRGDYFPNLLDRYVGPSSPLITSIKSLFSTLEDTLGSLQTKLKAEALLTLALAIAAIAGSVALMTLIDQTKLLGASLAIAGLTGVLAGGVALLGQVDRDGMLGAALAIIALAGATAIMALAAKQMAELDHDKLMKGWAAVSLLMVNMVLGLKGIAMGPLAQDLTKAAAALAIMGIALYIFSFSIERLGQLDYDELGKGLLGTAGGLLAFAVAIRIMSSAAIPANIVKAGLAMVLMAGSLYILYFAVEAFADLDWDELGRGLLGAGASLAGLVVAFMALQKGPFSGKRLLAAAVAVGIMAYSLRMLAVTIAVFGTIPWDVMKQGLINAALALAGLLGFFRLMPDEKKTLATGLALLAIVKALEKLAATLVNLGEEDWKVVARGLLFLGLALAGLAAATVVMAKALPGAAAIAVVSVAMIGLAYALTLLGELSWDQLWVALGALAGALVIFGLAGVILGPMLPVLIGIGMAFGLIGLGALGMGLGLTFASSALLLLAGSAVAIAEAIKIVGAAIIEILPAVGSAVGEMISNFLLAIFEAGPKVLEAAKEAFIKLVDAVVEVSPILLEAGMTMLLEFLSLLEKNVPKFVKKGFNILMGFLKGIRDNIEEVVEVSVEIVTNFLQGLTDSIPDLVDAAWEFIDAFIQAMIDASEEYGPNIVSNVQTLATDVVNGFADKLLELINVVTAAAKDVAEAAYDAWKTFWDTNSPSRRMQQSAEWVVEGFTGVLQKREKTVAKAMRSLGEKAQNGMKLALDSVNDLFKKDPEFSPTIRPVLDLSKVNMDRLDFSDVVARGAVALDARYASVRSIDQETARSNVQYIQNNYSPKALNRSEIYRKTKTQLGKLRSDLL